ncbi:hypothetical protein C2G38_2232702 [Gigaspora rosea]|uniref:Restriction endonuclease type IV Mrr domain-containing protein n=1 Tax=Gigaspora rosea TaxID=44941 RepID=A0A397TRS3_9GLOM|nr:hypothetical protein C2G38_2232702 [Gigaspora rosea]
MFIDVQLQDGYNFESIICQKLNLSDIIANEVKVNQGDGEIDIIATYKNNLVLIQCKSIEKPIAVQTVRNFESSVLRFPNSLEIIVCDSTKIKNEKYLTIKAHSWENDEELVIQDFQSDFFYFFNFKDENVKIERITVNQQIKKHGLFDETIEFFYMIIQKFNSVIRVHFMILSTENAKLCEAMCEKTISHINETTLQVLNEELKFILIFIWGHVGGNYRNNS